VRRARGAGRVVCACVRARIDLIHFIRAFDDDGTDGRRGLATQITVETVRLVRESDSGESTHEIMPLGEAIEAARAMGLDLVEVNGKASPPVCRAMDYERVRYDQKKRVKEQKKASAAAKRRDVIKELRLTAKIDAHDLNVKINGARKFLDAGHRVTFRILFKNSDGIALEKRPQRGAEIMDSVMGMLDDVEIVVKPKMVGPSHMTASVKRPSGKKK
jgi:translation initiation factor IF-3